MLSLHPQFPCKPKWSADWQDCPVCLEPITVLSGVVILPCTHRFCLACISRLKTCPLCRADMPMERDRITLHGYEKPSCQIWVIIPDTQLHDECYWRLRRAIWGSLGCISSICSVQFFWYPELFRQGRGPSSALEMSALRGQHLTFLGEINDLMLPMTQAVFCERYLERMIICIAQTTRFGQPVQAYLTYFQTQFAITKEDVQDAIQSAQNRGDVKIEHDLILYVP